MRKLAWLALVLVAGTGIASAQPAPDPNAPPPPPPAPSVAPGATWQQENPRLQLQLSPDDQQLLARGEISDGEWVGGGVASVLLGYGVGQAIQGRWRERGWIFTLGDATIGTVAAVGAVYLLGCALDDASCSGSAVPWLYAAIVADAALRIWEVSDAFAVPPARNARLRRLRRELGLPQPTSYGLAPYVAPTRSVHGDTAVAGLQLSF
jgi:hypothetical protein